MRKLRQKCLWIIHHRFTWKCNLFWQNTTLRHAVIKCILKDDVCWGRWQLRWCIVALMTVKWNHTSNKIRKQNCLPHPQVSRAGRDNAIDQRNKVANKLSLHNILLSFFHLGPLWWRNVKRGKVQFCTKLKKNPGSRLGLVFGYKLHFHDIWKRPLYVLFYVKVSNKHDVSSETHKIRKIKFGSKWPGIYSALRGARIKQ